MKILLVFPKAYGQRRAAGFRVCLALLFGALLFGALRCADLGAQAGPSPEANKLYTIAFSSTMFTEVNENDARASMKAWTMTIARDRDVPIDPDLRIFKSVEEMEIYCLSNEVDGIGLVTPEFDYLRRNIEFESVALGVKNGRLTEEYLLVVRENSGIDKVEQLRGRSINIVNNPRMSMAVIWLDTVLMEARLGRTSGFFGKTTYDKKVSQMVLPVFFGKTESCLMTRENFDVMAELNPQLKKQLKVLAFSPALVPSLFALRKGYKNPYRNVLLDAMLNLKDSPAGRQILTLTQADHIEAHPISSLNPSLDLIAKHRRLSGENLERTR